MFSKGRNRVLRAAVFVLAAVLALPAFALAKDNKNKNKNKGRGKPTEVFVNGHDARDGRWDKGGRRDRNRDRDDDYYDDDDDRDDRRRRRNRDGYGSDRTEIRRQASDYGYREGYEDGRDDRDDGNRYDYRDESTYRDATSGYRDEYGDRNLYRQYFRQAYEQGYRDGYEGRSGSTRRGIGGVLGDIFGRP